MESSKYKYVLFRELVKLKTDYATHNLYPYPAKFIPNVVRYFLETYTKEGQTVFDPFAGSGTVGIEAEITGRNYILWDLNPVLEILTRAETWKGEINEKLFEVDFNYPKVFVPKWKNLTYWYPKEFIETLSRLWGYYHDHPNPLLAIPLFRISKYFSYADFEYMHYYKSKVSVRRVNELLKGNWKEEMKDLYYKEVERIIRKVREFQSMCRCVSEGVVKGGVDVLTEIPPNADAVITSPPYLRAFDYIRAFRIELFWLGFTEEEVRRLRRKQIPYNRPPAVEIRSNTYKEYLRKVKSLNRKDVLKIYLNYFNSLVYFFNKVRANVIGIFVGPVKIMGIRIPIDEILKEHLESTGWKHEVTYIDRIVVGRLKKVKINPAIGTEDERTPTEHLLVMKRI